MFIDSKVSKKIDVNPEIWFNSFHKIQMKCHQIQSNQLIKLMLLNQFVLCLMFIHSIISVL